MHRSAALVFVVALGLSAAACKTTPSSDAQPQAATRDFKGEEKIRFQDDAGGSSGGSSGWNWVAVPFENVVYLPWKFVGGALKGTVDGAGAGFGKDRMPILGAIFSPVNAVVGLVTGAFEGLALSPFLVGPDDSFGRAMSQPTKHATTIWWYE